MKKILLGLTFAAILLSSITAFAFNHDGYQKHGGHGNWHNGHSYQEHGGRYIHNGANY